MQTILLLRPKTAKTYQQLYFDEVTIIILNATHVPEVQHNHRSMEYIVGRRWHPSSQLIALALHLLYVYGLYDTSLLI